MTTAEKMAKENTEIAKGVVKVKGPDGETEIFVRPPRGPGPWFRVKHIQYGHRLIQAATEDEAIQKFFAEFTPGFADDLNWCRESMKLNGGRIARLPGSEPPAVETPKSVRKVVEKS